MRVGPKFAYRKKVQSGQLKADDAQRLLSENLQNLHYALKGYVPDDSQRPWKKWLGLTERQSQPLKGLYIYGGVGTGKSMLMDLFFDTVPVKSKRRAHFHEFLQDVHIRFNNLRKSNKQKLGDPIPKVVDELAEEVQLLCFDELQVYNIVDAMILGRLFEGLFAKGVVVVATSNRPPNDLYKDGLQREKFLPFIELITKHLEVFKLDTTNDYRLERMLDMRIYHCPADQSSKMALDEYFFELAGGRPSQIEGIEVKGRVIKILASSGVARKSFNELCEQPLGVADYLAIADRYHTLIIERIPCMSDAEESQARRFVNLIDALYEAKVNLICSAEAMPQDLYVKGEGVFEFERLDSRLMEMQSVDYLSLPHGKVINPSK